MSRIFVALFSGIIFGLGLTVSGMIDPTKVLGFLDVTGSWDPTLAFVMLGALLVATPAVHLILRRSHPILADSFALPTKTAVDARLLGGATLFGIGWGMVGFCPGPSVAALATGLVPVFVFVGAMLVGMALYQLIFVRQTGGDAGKSG